MLVQIEFFLALPGGDEFGFGEVGFLSGHTCTHDWFALRSDPTPLSIGLSLVIEYALSAAIFAYQDAGSVYLTLPLSIINI